MKPIVELFIVVAGGLTGGVIGFALAVTFDGVKERIHEWRIRNDQKN